MESNSPPSLWTAVPGQPLEAGAVPGPPDLGRSAGQREQQLCVRAGGLQGGLPCHAEKGKKREVRCEVTAATE